MPLFSKHRKYPIRRDQYGRSMRAQAFYWFQRGYRPSEIIQQGLVKAKMKTLLRYYADWKKRGGIPSVKILKEHMAKHPEINYKVVSTLALRLGITEEEVSFRLQKPWGLVQLLKGATPDADDINQTEIERRLEAASRILSLADLFGNRAEDFSILIGAIMRLRDNQKLEIVKNNGIIQLIGVIKDKTSQ
jgi:hypothetical protein